MYLETLRGSVQTWECDINAHMNVQFYVSRAAHSLIVLAHRLGLTPDRQRSERIGFIADEHHIRFHRERNAGDPILMHAGILKATDDALQLLQVMRCTATDAVVATFLTQCQLVNLDDRKARRLPSSAIEHCGELNVEPPDYASARGVATDPPRPTPTLAEADALGMKTTHTSVITPQDDDGFGYLAVAGFMGRVSDAIPVLVAATPGLNRGGDSDMGGAALEYRFVYRRYPKVGDVVTLRSGLKAVGGKTYNWCHWLFDLATSDCLATAEAVVVSLDLINRRAAALPEADRQLLLDQVIPGLSA